MRDEQPVDARVEDPADLVVRARAETGDREQSRALRGTHDGRELTTGRGAVLEVHDDGVEPTHRQHLDDLDPRQEEERREQRASVS